MLQCGLGCHSRDLQYYFPLVTGLQMFCHSFAYRFTMLLLCDSRFAVNMRHTDALLGSGFDSGTEVLCLNEMLLLHNESVTSAQGTDR
jgi:hypothetical protein